MAMDPRVVLDGLVFPEVPRWRDGQLWFSDFQLWLPGMTGQVIVVDQSGTARTGTSATTTRTRTLGRTSSVTRSLTLSGGLPSSMCGR